MEHKFFLLNIIIKKVTMWNTIFFKKITASLTLCGSPPPLFPINPRANKFSFPTPIEKLGSKINLEISMMHKKLKIILHKIDKMS
jgi:hypothetical protein